MFVGNASLQLCLFEFGDIVSIYFPIFVEVTGLQSASPIDKPARVSQAWNQYISIPIAYIYVGFCFPPTNQKWKATRLGLLYFLTWTPSTWQLQERLIHTVKWCLKDVKSVVKTSDLLNHTLSMSLPRLYMDIINLFLPLSRRSPAVTLESMNHASCMEYFPTFIHLCQM